MKGETKGFLIFGVIFVLRDLIFITGDENHQRAGNIHSSKHRSSLMAPYLFILEFMSAFYSPPPAIT